MKKIFSSIVALACATVAFSQSFSISGTVQGLPEGSVIQLVPGATHQDEKPVSSATVNQGKFELKGSTDSPRYFYLTIKDAYGSIPILLDQGNKVRLETTAKLSGGDENAFYNFENQKIIGAPLHDEYQRKIAPREELDKKHGGIQEKFGDVSNKLSAAHAAKDSVLAEQIRQSAEWKAYEDAESEFFQTAGDVIGKIITDNKDSWWGPLLTLNMYNYFPPQHEYLYDNLAEVAKNSYYGQVLKEQVRPEGFLNQQAPSVLAHTTEGTAFNLQQTLTGKKVILIDFWASWCAPCRKKIPELKALYEKYKDQGLEIVGISIDKKDGDWRKALDQEQLPYPNYIDLGETANNWKVRAIPAVFLVDDSGKVIAENVELDQVEAYFRK